MILAPDSGRGFLQDLVSRGKYAPGGGHFFETLKSQRRLSLCAELSEKLARKVEAQLVQKTSWRKSCEALNTPYIPS